MSDDPKLFLVWATSIPSNPNRTRYQRANLFCKKFPTTVLAIGDVSPTIREGSYAVYSFPDRTLYRPLFPFWAIMILLVERVREGGVFYVHVSPHIESILAGVGCIPTDLIWIQDIWDDPLLPASRHSSDEGLTRRVGRYGLIGIWKLEKLLIPRSDLLILALHEDYLNEAGIHHGNVCKVTNGVIRNLQTTKSVSLPGFNLTYVGQVKASRGISEMLDLTSNLSNFIPNVRLNFIGVDSEQEPQLNHLIDEENLVDNVRIIGEVDHEIALAYIQKSDVCFCILSEDVRNYKYSYPIKLFEYMSFGKLTIISNTMGVNEIVSNGNFTISITDDSCAEEISEFYADEILQSEISRDAKSRAAEYSWDNINDHILDCLVSA